MGRHKISKPLNADLLAALRLLNEEVPEYCTPAEAWAWVRPVTPHGVAFMPWCFWGKLRAEIAWRDKITDHRAELIAAWIRNKKTLQTEWPPVPLFTEGPSVLPMPWTGKDEKPGRVPWDGKK